MVLSGSCPCPDHILQGYRMASPQILGYCRPWGIKLDVITLRSLSLKIYTVSLPVILPHHHCPLSQCDLVSRLALACGAICSFESLYSGSQSLGDKWLHVMAFLELAYRSHLVRAKQQALVYDGLVCLDNPQKLGTILKRTLAKVLCTYCT